MFEAQLGCQTQSIVARENGQLMVAKISARNPKAPIFGDDVGANSR